MPSARWSAPASPQAVSVLRTAVVAFAGDQSVLDPPLGDLKLAVSEAITNAVLHAFRSGEPGRVTVTVDVEPAESEVTVVVADDGGGMVPRPDSPGLGLGLPLIGTLADTFEVRTPADGHGTEVAMTFHLPLAASPSD
jgi:serine/threonine-protein kinase RsbW/stage II sporulation protein AB (anti-sigma F factor)